MTERKRFWFGIAFIVGAVVVFLLSIHIVDVPGPISADKPEFLFESSTSLIVISDFFGLLVLTFLLWRPKDRT